MFLTILGLRQFPGCLQISVTDHRYSLLMHCTKLEIQRFWWFQTISNIFRFLCKSSPGQYTSEAQLAITGADPGFPVRASASPAGGANIWFCQNFQQTTWNWENFGSWRAPPRSTTAWLNMVKFPLNINCQHEEFTSDQPEQKYFFISVNKEPNLLKYPLNALCT